MFQTISKFLAISSMALLAACSGASPEHDAPVAVLPAAPAAAAVVVEYAPQPAATPAPGTRVLAAAVNVLVTPPQVSESERVAEELRLVDFEQSFSIEMNRRHQEQAERSARAAIAARAGVVQGPGCEGTEGHAAVECEQSLI
jgi:hypothetical protein